MPLPAPESPLPSESASMAANESSDSGALVHAKELPPARKLTAIGTHLGHAGMMKLRELQLRGPRHYLNAQHVWELVNYASAVLHLDTMYDRSAATVADAQHALFARAATAATNIQSFIDKHPQLAKLEHALEPYALTTKSLVESTAMRLLTSLHAGLALTSDFFANRTSDFTVISRRASEFAVGIVTSLRKSRPDWEQHVHSLLDNLRATFHRSQELFNYVAELPREQLASAVTAMYSLINQLFASINAFRQNLITAGKEDTELVTYASVAARSPAEAESDDAHSSAHPSSSSSSGFSKKRRGSRK